LAQRLLRVAHDERLELPARTFPPEVGIDDIEPVLAYGVLDAARALWEELGIGPLLREKLRPDGGDAPHEMALLAMTANRLARPASTWACDAPWLADAVDGPEAQAWALAPLARALDCLLRHVASREQELFFHTADRFNAEVDVLCGDTTTLSCEIDDDDDAGAVWEDQAIPALRQRGHRQEGRDGNPQVVVGLALTRDGLPVRSWVVPGNTAEVPTIHHLTEDLQGWRLHRGVVVGESGMVSEAHRQRLSRALGRDMLAVPRRRVTAVQLAVLTRAARSREVAHNLRGQEVYGGAGERRRRSVVCHTPAEAAREHTHRARLLAWARAELTALDPRQADHPTNACELMASRRFGRSLTLDARGRLRINAAKVAADATDEGKFVVTTHADPLDAADVALGDTSMPRIEGGFRQMKTTGLQTRPIDHWRPHRLIAQVKRCVLALLRQRAAESRCQQTWRTIRQPLDQVKGVRYRRHGTTIVQRTQVTAPMAEILPSLGIPVPKKILDVDE
jgi:hypothetical protein